MFFYSLFQGEYKVVNAPFDVGPFAGIPTLHGYWIAKVTLFIDGKEVGCQTMEAMIKPKKIIGQNKYRLLFLNKTCKANNVDVIRTGT